jgi:GTP-binding protein HflX
LLLHVIDASAVDRERRANAVRSVLLEVGAAHIPTLDVFNKRDLLDAGELARLQAMHPSAVFVSARTGAGRGELTDILASRLELDAEPVHFDLDNTRDADRRLLGEIYRHARVTQHVTTGPLISIDADVPRRLRERLARGKVPA